MGRLDLKSPILIIHDVDGHGVSCGVAYLHALRSVGFNARVYSHYNPVSTLRTVKSNLRRVVAVRGRGFETILIVDFPLEDLQNIYLLDGDSRIVWLDHHDSGLPHSRRITCGSSLDLTLHIPITIGHNCELVREWAIAGAVLDQDPSVVDHVDERVEEEYCEILDQALKRCRIDIVKRVYKYRYSRKIEESGDVGAVTEAIVEEELKPRDIVDMFRDRVKRLPLPDKVYVLENVVYIDTTPPVGYWWKYAWKLCYTTRRRVAILPVYSTRDEKHWIIIAKYWRERGKIADIVDSYIMERFRGRQVYGRKGARVVEATLREVLNIEKIARELDEKINMHVETGKL